MHSILVKTKNEYTVDIGGGLLKKVGASISFLSRAKKIMVVSDSTVFPLYGKKLMQSLEILDAEIFTFVFEAGEERKRLSTVEELLESMAENHFTRSDIIIAFGGGVCGDMAGFAAAIYARGIDFVQIPTTLLAAVDSSVGGKTAVDLSGGKNLCGAFHQPIAVICDTDTFKTLDKEKIGDGLAEMLKYGVICDGELFEKVQNFENEDRDALVARCVEIKNKIVSEDENDRGKRQLLNLGHTIGHAVEAASDFKITHGHAVAIGMAMISRAAETLGYAKKGLAKKVVKALERCGLPTKTDIDTETLFALTLSDKKASGDHINLIIPKEIGVCEIVKVKAEEVKTFIEAGR